MSITKTLITAVVTASLCLPAFAAPQNSIQSQAKPTQSQQAEQKKPAQTQQVKKAPKKAAPKKATPKASERTTKPARTSATRS
ncbi:MAG: hypothetical protein Q4B88_05675 [Moraxella sp.]|nr:hypothetical protein [Moraxella sp.]